MINVVASIRVKPGKSSEFLEIFKANVPNVKEERGCIEYIPTIDIDGGSPAQVFDENIVTVIEKWENLEALHGHFSAPHQLAYKEKVKDLVEGSSLKILQEA